MVRGGALSSGGADVQSSGGDPLSGPAKRPKRRRLDELLLDQGFVQDLKAARGWIMAGKVVVDGTVVSKPGTACRESADIHLRGRPLRYASRGGYKLAHGLARFGISVEGRVCLDAGAAAGGFTDCLLQHGAGQVTAVEVGYGQLRGALATDPRVDNRERTNIGDVKRSDLDPPIDFACADLSYLSVAKAVPLLAPLFPGPISMVILVKPLFEGLGQDEIAEPAALGTTLERLFTTLAATGFAPSGLCVSPLLGSGGAVEFLACFDRRGSLSPLEASAAALTDLSACPPVDLARWHGGQNPDSPC